MHKMKYQNVLHLGQKLEIKNSTVKEENGDLRVTGMAKISIKKFVLG